MNEKMKVILKKNAEYERQTPYNFCDRWCERCHPSTQRRCQLYLDELGRQMANIAHGREPDDLEILEQDFAQMALDIEEAEDSWLDDEDWEDDLYDEETLQTVEDKRKELNAHPLMKVTRQYEKITLEFLNKYFYDKIPSQTKIEYNFETLSWYFRLLPTKMQRALSNISFSDPFDPDEYLLCDAVAQLGICKKAIILSIEALRKIVETLPGTRSNVIQLLALLHNIASQIKILEESI